MSFAFLVVLSAIASGMLAAVAVAIRRRRATAPLRLSDLSTAVSVLLACTLAQWLVLPAAFHFGRFALINILYVQLVVAAPVAALALLGRRWWPAGRSLVGYSVSATCVLVLISLAAPVGAYATFVEPFRVSSERVSATLPKARTGSAAITVGVIADIQTDEVAPYHRRAVELLMNHEPDVILIAGDVYQGPERLLVGSRLSSFRDLLASLRAPGGVYIVQGDCDSGDRLERLTAGTGVRVLRDQIAEVVVADRKLAIGGVHLIPDSSPVLEALMSRPDDTVRILLGHRPDWVLRLPDRAPVDLTVAGHTHGGQIQLPFIGPLITFSTVPNEIGAGGLHEFHGNRVYVSSGVGWEHAGAPRIRFMAPPTVGLVTLE